LSENLEALEGVIEKYQKEGGTLIGLLQDVVAVYRYLPEEALERLSERLNIPLSKFYTLATFFKSFRLEPMGEYHVCVCVGTACHVNGAQKIVDSLERELNIKSGDTTGDKKYTLETVNCLGACALGPLVLVNGEYHSKMDQNKTVKMLTKLQKAAEK
jgi:NADH:ubiquinone oxidoreductase subunit E